MKKIVCTLLCACILASPAAGLAALAAEDALSRAGAVRMLWASDGEPVVNYLLQFRDVPPEGEDTEAIRWAASLGVVNGYAADSFAPADAVTAEQAVVMLWRYAKYRGADATAPEDAALPEGASSWAAEALRWAVYASLLTEDLKPAAPVSAEDFAALLAKVRGRIAPDYSDDASWAYRETGAEGKDADVFFICPAVFGGKEGSYNMDLSIEKTKANFLGTINMEKGIYDGNARFFAPYYRQAGYNVTTLGAAEREPYLFLAFQDVERAFDDYMEHDNNGRPIILAGFSEGADMAIRLIKDRFADETLRSRLIACYAIGWRLTEEDVNAYPQLRPARGEDDLGVVIAFNSEAEDITDSLMIPEGTWTYAINPLNWKTDGTVADKGLNLGACFMNYDGEITEEIPALTGAYIDSTRGALKVTDVTPEQYPPVLSIFEDGIYHLYDYQFFYRNLEQNVQTRIAAYLGAAADAAA